MAEWQPISSISKELLDGRSLIGLYWKDRYRRGDVVRMWWQPEFNAFISSCRQMTFAAGYTDTDGNQSHLHSPEIEEPDFFMIFEPPEAS